MVNITGFNGKAYGFLKSDKDYEVVKSAIEFSNRQAPSGLEITVTKGMDKLQQPGIPEQLRRFADLAFSVGGTGELIDMNYLVEATSPGSTNHETAVVLNDIMGQLYNDPDLYEPGADMRYEVVRGENGNYGYLR